MTSKLRLFLLVSVPLYALLLSLSFRGVVLQGEPLAMAQSIYNHEYDYTLQWVYVATALALSAAWLASLHGFENLAHDDRAVLGVGALLGALSAAAYPGVNSNDILAYVAYGRIMGVYCENPWTHSYSAFQDSYAPFAWYPHPMPYGPMVAPFLAVAGVLSSVAIPLAFYFIKLCWLGVHLYSGWLVMGIARALGQPARWAGWAFVTCPLLLIELVNNGHCDGLMVMFALLSVRALVRRESDGEAALALFYGLLAVLVKPTAILLLAVEVAYLVRKGRFVPLLGGAVVALGVVGVLSQTLFANADARSALTNPHLLTNAHSFHSVFFHARHERYLRVYEETSYRPMRQAIAGLFAIFCLWRLLAVRTRADVIREYLWMTLALMLFYSARVWPWYVAWLLPFAVVCDYRPLRRMVLLYCVSMFAVYAVPFALFWRSLSWHVVRVLLSSGLPLAWLVADAMRGREAPANGPQPHGSSADARADERDLTNARVEKTSRRG